MALSVRRAKRQMTPVESVPVTAPDGQPIARPGDLDLSMYFAGMRVKRVTVSDDGMILIGFGKPPAGWWRACDTGRRIICRGQVADLTVWSAPKPGVAIDRAYTQALTAVMETWKMQEAVIEAFGAPGRLALFRATSPEGVRYAAFHEIRAPDSHGRWP